MCPSGACLPSAAFMSCQRLQSAAGESGECQLRARLLLPSLAVTHGPHFCLYRDMGAGHPSLTEKKGNKDEMQVRSHPETRRQGLACERGPPRRWGYFWSRQGIHPVKFTLLEFQSCQHLKDIDFLSLLLLKGDTWNLNR